MIIEWHLLKVLLLGIFFGAYVTRLMYKFNQPKTFEIKSFQLKKK